MKSAAPNETATERLAIWTACLFLFILPNAHTVALRNLALVIIVILALYLAWRERPVRLPLALPLAAWVLLAGLSLFWSIDPDYSQREFRNETIAPCLAFLAFFVLARTERAIRLFISVLFLSGGLVALIVIVQYFATGTWQTKSFFSVGDVGAYSTYAALVVLALVVAMLEKDLRTLPPVLAWTVIALVVTAAALTRNRALWLALAAGTLTYLLLRWHGNKTGLLTTKRRMAALIFVTFSLLATVFFAIHKEKALRHAPDGSSITFMVTDARFDIWRHAADRIGERPLFGHGFGRGILRQDFRATFGNTLMWHGHNMFVNYALELGAAGVSILLWLLFALFRTLWRLHMAMDATVRSLGSLGLAVLASMLVKIQFDDLLIRENSLLFWSLMGICVGLRNIREYGHSDYQDGAITGDLASPLRATRSTRLP
jgi:O-antigen ligase